MDDKILIAIIAAVSAMIGGLITAVLGPWIKHHLDQIATNKSQRREQLHKWRAMLLQVSKDCEFTNEVGQALQLHPDYMVLEPLLSEAAKKSIYSENRAIVVGQSLPNPLERVKNEIARIEKEWGF